MTASELANQTRARQRTFIYAAFAASLVLGGLFVVAQGNVILPIVALLSVATLGILWNFPALILPFTLAGACLFELTISLTFTWPRTDQIPLFWDFNTIMQRYAHKPDFHALPLSPFEMLLIVAFVAWLLRGIMYHTLNVRLGALVVPMGLFLVCIGIALANGLATGGALNFALMEVRALVYFIFAYIMAMNGVNDPSLQAHRMLWITAICVGIKAVQAAVRYFGELHGTTIPEVGIGSHEESFFFDVFVIQFIVLLMAGLEKKLCWFMALLMPLVLYMDLVNQRRAATAAVMIVMPILMAMAYVAFAHRRRMIIGIAVFVAIASAFYFPAFWNKSGSIAQPARALKSQFDPDPRDLSSNVYRDAEDANLLLTMKQSPIIGYGYGKLFLIIVPMVDLTSIDPLIHRIPHNSVLWIWMRTGTVGYVAFWVLCGSIMMLAAQTCRRRDSTPQMNMVAVYVACILMMLLVFGLLDMQLSNIRNMLFTGLWVGMLAYFRWDRDNRLPSGEMLIDGSCNSGMRPAIDEAPALAGRGAR